MTIETKFDVNNLVKAKFDKGTENHFQLFEVMQVETNTCYAGTQNFYLCRAITAKKKFKDEWSKKGEFEWLICHGIGSTDFAIGWGKYREDELVEAPKEQIDIILGGGSAE